MNEIYDRGKSCIVCTLSATDEYNQVLHDIIKTEKFKGIASVKALRYSPDKIS